MMTDKQIDNAIEIITTWMTSKVKEANKKGVVIGLSGGLDSAVVAILAKIAFDNNILCINMPCWSNPQDKYDAETLSEEFDLPFKVIELDDAYEDIRFKLKDDTDKVTKVMEGNIKARLRMTTLYLYAQLNDYLVLGTTNKSEYNIGYGTKWGDSACDLLPIADIYKTDLYDIAKTLEIPDEILSKKPSAGLWEGQTDEDELGFSYEVLDQYLKTEEIDDKEIQKKIDKMILSTEHKREPIPACMICLI